MKRGRKGDNNDDKITVYPDDRLTQTLSSVCTFLCAWCFVWVWLYTQLQRKAKRRRRKYDLNNQHLFITMCWPDGERRAIFFLRTCGSVLRMCCNTPCLCRTQISDLFFFPFLSFFVSSKPVTTVLFLRFLPIFSLLCTTWNFAKLYTFLSVFLSPHSVCPLRSDEALWRNVIFSIKNIEKSKPQIFFFS